MKPALTKAAIVDALRQHRPDLFRLGVKTIALFGSYAKDTHTDSSDLDFVVEFSTPTYDNFIGLEQFLERLFGRRVDILTPAGLESIRVPGSPRTSSEPSCMSKRGDREYRADARGPSANPAGTLRLLSKVAVGKRVTRARLQILFEAQCHLFAAELNTYIDVPRLPPSRRLPDKPRQQPSKQCASDVA